MRHEQWPVRNSGAGGWVEEAKGQLRFLVCPIKELFLVVSGEPLKDFRQRGDPERFGFRKDHSSGGCQGLVGGG